MTTGQLVSPRLRTASHRPAAKNIPALVFGSDLVLMLAAVVVAALLRTRWSSAFGDTDVSERLGVFGPLMLACWLVSIWLNDGYHRSVLELGADEYRRVALSSAFTLGLMSAGCYLFKVPMSRAFLFLAFAIGVPALLAGRLVVRTVLRRQRADGRFQHRVVIAGRAESVDDVARVFARERRLGFSLVGAVIASDASGFETRTGIPVLGSTRDIGKVAVESGADTLFLAPGAVASNEEMRNLVWDLEDHEIQVVVAPDVSEISSARVRIRPVGGLPLVHIERPRVQRALRSGKRTFDVVASALMLLLAAPIFLLSAVWIRRSDGGPVMFRQARVGQDGTEFSCLKFRTMVTNAEDLLEDLRSEQGFDGGLFKMEEDPRITAPGRWLRRFSVDELPQLVNVLRGEMSLVGPRPPLRSEVDQYLPHAHRRLRVRPGLTGLWQVSGRSDLSFDDAIRLDLYYVDNWSIIQDLSILFRTLGAVIWSRGAY